MSCAGRDAGVWVSSGKIAATGIRATRWISYHGIALNVSADLAPFDNIVPCGVEGRPVASVCKHMKLPGCSGEQQADDASLMKQYSEGIVEAFKQEFQVTVSRTEYQLD